VQISEGGRETNGLARDSSFLTNCKNTMENILLKKFQLALPRLSILLQKCTRVLGSVPTLQWSRGGRTGQKRTFLFLFRPSVIAVVRS